MSDIAGVVERYFAAWNATDAAELRARIAEAWSADGSYRDPLLAADGHDGIAAMVAAVHEQYPGYVFRRAGEIDSHHDRLRFAWELVGPDGTPFVSGIDVGVVDADGRLQAISGFFDQVPVLATQG